MYHAHATGRYLSQALVQPAAVTWQALAWTQPAKVSGYVPKQSIVN